MGGITDVASAESAVQEIELEATSLERIVSDTIPALNTPERVLILETISGEDAEIVKAFEAAGEVPGVTEVIQPSVTRFRDALRSVLVKDN